MLHTGTPMTWRLAIGTFVAALATFVCLSTETIGHKGQAGLGLLCFFGLAAMFSANLRQVRLKTLFWGVVLQFGLALAVIKSENVRDVFKVIGRGIGKLIECSDVGADFVFGSLSSDKGPAGFVFAFKILPPIIFISAFFSVLYYLGVVQILVKGLAYVMRIFMGTSGAESLSVAANVFMGQTEAPLIVKPYVPKMTQSELLALMASGMAHISGSLMAVYVTTYGADPASILAACIMACPCSLYLTKLVLPETGVPETNGTSSPIVKVPYVNAIDAAAGGVRDGLFLALNVGAMLIAFLAFIALFDKFLGGIKPGLIYCGMTEASLARIPDDMKLQTVFGWLFSPVATLMGVENKDSHQVGSLLGIKLAANEHVAFLSMKKNPEFADLSERSRKLAVYALSGFANFSSIGIQLGGIGAIAENRRHDLAKLGLKALFIGYLATLINASVAGLLM